MDPLDDYTYLLYTSCRPFIFSASTRQAFKEYHSQSLCRLWNLREPTAIPTSFLLPSKSIPCVFFALGFPTPNVRRYDRTPKTYLKHRNWGGICKTRVLLHPLFKPSLFLLFSLGGRKLVMRMWCGIHKIRIEPHSKRVVVFQSIYI